MQALFSSLAILSFTIILNVLILFVLWKGIIMNRFIFSLLGGAVVSLSILDANAFWHRDVQRDTQNTAQSFQIADASLDKKAEKSEEKALKAEKHSLKAMKKAAKKSNNQWLARKSDDINEDFDEAVYKIGKSSLPQEVKNLLLSQANEDKNLALKQAKETSSLLEKQQLSRNKFSAVLAADKHSKKLIKKIDDIVK